MLVEDGFYDVEIENSNGDREDHEQAHTFWSLSEDGSQADQGLWATGNSMVDGEPYQFLASPGPIGGDDGVLPAPDPNLFATYDGSQGKGTPGTATGSAKNGAERLVDKVKGAVT